MSEKRGVPKRGDAARRLNGIYFLNDVFWIIFSDNCECGGENGAECDRHQPDSGLK